MGQVGTKVAQIQQTFSHKNRIQVDQYSKLFPLKTGFHNSHFLLNIGICGKGKTVKNLTFSHLVHLTHNQSLTEN